MNKEKRDLLIKHHTFALLGERKIVKKKSRTIAQLECKGVMTADKNLWSSGLRDHCLSKYCGVSSAQELLKGFHVFLSIAADWRIEKRPMPELTLSHVVRAKTGLTKGTASGGGSRLTSDMLCVLPLTLCFYFLEICKQRYFGGEELIQAPTSWHHILLIFLNKVGLPSRFTQFRGIALLDAMAKWYMAAVVLSIAEQIRPSRVAHAACFAYEPGRQCGEMLLIISLIFQVLWEWRGKFEVVFVSWM